MRRTGSLRPRGRGRRGRLRGSPLVRLRVGFVLIAMVLSLFSARLVQLQGIDPKAYAQMAADEGTVDVVLPATRCGSRSRSSSIWRVCSRADRLVA